MMNLQKKILNDYRALFPDETLREISAKTGIQLTRVFRIFNNSPMKLAEYEIFNGLIEQVDLDRPDLIELFKSCENKLGREAMNEIESMMHRKLRLWSLLNSHQMMTERKAA